MYYSIENGCFFGGDDRMRWISVLIWDRAHRDVQLQIILYSIETSINSRLLICISIYIWAVCVCVGECETINIISKMSFKCNAYLAIKGRCTKLVLK